MKVFKTVMKILAALAAVAGIVYVVATYGDKIAAWAKRLFNWCKDKCCCCCGDDDCCCCDDDCCEAAEAEAEITEEATAQADEADFEG